MIATCAAWNIVGARAVGEGRSGCNGAAISAVCGDDSHGRAPQEVHGSRPADHRSIFDLEGGILIAMWNYMGWDNLSTIAGEVDRPQRLTRWPCRSRDPGDRELRAAGRGRRARAPESRHLDARAAGWTRAQRSAADLALAIASGRHDRRRRHVRALMLSFTRLPAVMAADGFLPEPSGIRAKTGAPVGGDPGLRRRLGGVLAAGICSAADSRRAADRV